MKEKTEEASSALEVRLGQLEVKLLQMEERISAMKPSLEKKELEDVREKLYAEIVRLEKKFPAEKKPHEEIKPEEKYKTKKDWLEDL